MISDVPRVRHTYAHRFGDGLRVQYAGPVAAPRPYVVIINHTVRLAWDRLAGPRCFHASQPFRLGPDVLRYSLGRYPGAPPCARRFGTASRPNVRSGGRPPS